MPVAFIRSFVRHRWSTLAEHTQIGTGQESCPGRQNKAAQTFAAAAVGTAAFGLGAWLIFASGAIHAAVALTNADNQPLAAHASPLNPAIAIPLAIWALCVALALYGALRRDARQLQIGLAL